jgi:phosphohistidine phosphatase
MKILWLARHAHAEVAAASDFDRRLSAAGILEAQGMGERLRQRGHAPQLILASAASRAAYTAQLLAQSLDAPPPRFERELYNSSVAVLLQTISATAASVSSLMLVAHNPGISELVSLLSQAQPVAMPPCGIAEIHFDSAEDWPDLASMPGKLAWIGYPGKSH